MENHTLYTIGHSNHSAETFIGILQANGVNLIADVRSNPYSRICPHFNQPALRSGLAAAGMMYVFWGKELGARPNDMNCYVDGRVSYERLAGRGEFQNGLRSIRGAILRQSLALLCAEKDPIECHRMILICRYMRSPDLIIRHIHADGTTESNADAEHRLCRRLRLYPSLFADEAEIIEEAYDQQSKRIAYGAKETEGI